MNRRLRTFTVTLAAAAVATTAACGGDDSSSGDKPTLRIGYFPVISPVPFMQDEQILEDQGYEVEWVQLTEGLPGAATALAAGQLDLSWGNSASATVIFSESPDAARFVGQSFVNENITVVSKDSGITSPEQLADRKTVVSGERTASTLFYEIGLVDAGVDPESNEYFVSGTGTGMIGVLDSGDAEVAATYVPFAADMVLRGIGDVLFTATDVMGSDAAGDGFIASKQFIDEHPDALVDVLRAQFEATSYIEENPDEAYARIAEFADVSEDAVAFSFEEGHIGLADSFVPDVEGIRKIAERAQERGFAPEEVDDLSGFVDTFVDTSYAEQAMEE